MREENIMSDNLTDWKRRNMSPQISLQVPARGRHSQEQLSRILRRRKTDRSSAVQLSWWRSHFIGYPASILLVSLAVVLSYMLKTFASVPYFLGQPFVFVTAVIALLWGTSTVLFAIVLEYIAIDIFIVSPFHVFIIEGWDDMITFGPFILVQLVIAFLTIQSESRRRHLLKAKQEVEAEARELDRANRFKSLFLSLASHELKTPITAIRAQAQLALRRSARSQTAPERPSLSMHLEKIEA